MKVKIKRSIALSDSGFVFDASTGDSYSLNPMGLEIMNLIKSGKSDSEITRYMTEKYDVDSSAFERYFYDFVVTLKQMQIIEDYE
jgi:PqqD family protein of HPr-rel-A system